MIDDIYSMTKSGFREAMRQAKEEAWLEGHAAGRRDEYCLDPNPYAPKGCDV